jgi:hypothetical protein
LENKVEVIWVEAAVTYSNVISQICLQALRIVTKTSVKIADFLVEESNPGPLKFRAQVLTTEL